MGYPASFCPPSKAQEGVEAGVQGLVGAHHLPERSGRQAQQLRKVGRDCGYDLLRLPI
jgi:hypothetical protein